MPKAINTPNRNIIIMDNESKTVIVIILVCIAALAVGYGIYTSLKPSQIEPYGPMTGEDVRTPLGAVSDIPWDEVIYIPLYPECEGEKMVLINNITKIEYENNTTVYHWLYTCEKAEMNRTNIKVDATRLPDYELPK